MPRVFYQPNEGLPPLRHWHQWVSFLGWSIVSTCRAVWNLLHGDWWDAVMLGEETKAMVVHLADQEDLAVEYLFSHQHFLSGYRPLWTYEAERCGCKITLYFYSTNNVNPNPKNPTGYLSKEGG